MGMDACLGKYGLALLEQIQLFFWFAKGTFHWLKRLVRLDFGVMNFQALPWTSSRTVSQSQVNLRTTAFASCPEQKIFCLSNCQDPCEKLKCWWLTATVISDLQCGLCWLCQGNSSGVTVWTTEYNYKIQPLLRRNLSLELDKEGGQEEVKWDRHFYPGNILPYTSGSGVKFPSRGEIRTFSCKLKDFHYFWRSITSSIMLVWEREVTSLKGS